MEKISMENKILVIDEDQQTLASLQGLLVAKGFLVKLSAEADLLHQHVADFEPDLLIMEIQHGFKDGRILCDEVKQASGSSDLPIILITTLPYEQITVIECQADAILGKPYLAENLLMTIRDLLEN